MRLPLLAVEFDGVIHSCTSGWQGVDVIADRPVENSLEFLAEAVKHFNVAIYSSRSSSSRGLKAMDGWLRDNMRVNLNLSEAEANAICDRIRWPRSRPPAAVMTIDNPNRTINFSGTRP